MKENDGLKQNLKAVTEKALQIKQRYETLKINHKEVKGQFIEKDKELEEQTKDYVALTEELDGIEADYEKEKISHEEAKAELASLTSQNDTMQQQIDTLQAGTATQDDN